MLLIRLTNDPAEILKTLENFHPKAGDHKLAEDSMGGVLVSALDPRIGWRTDIKNLYYRFVIVITDAEYRFPGDASRRICPWKIKPNDGDGVYDNTKEVSIG